MANEITLSGLTLAFAKTGSPSVSLTAPTINVTVAGTQYMDNVQNIGTAEEAILMGDVAAGGICYIQNLNSTNFVSIRQATGAANFMKLLAGEWALLRISADTTAPYAIADTAACDVRILRFDL